MNKNIPNMKKRRHRSDVSCTLHRRSQGNQDASELRVRSNVYHCRPIGEQRDGGNSERTTIATHRIAGGGFKPACEKYPPFMKRSFEHQLNDARELHTATLLAKSRQACNQ
eukprot:735904-Amphidinium_carterae.2